MLYYPFANASTPVIQQAALYWDGLRTVVAPGWKYRLSDHMRQIEAVGLFTPIEPHDSYQPVPLPRIASELNSALRQVPLDDLIPPANAPDGHAGTLHVEKLHDSVVQELLRRQLVYQHPASPTRLVGSPALQHIVISIVAGYIANELNSKAGYAGPLGLHPHTDVNIAYRLSIDPLPGQRVADCWNIEIGPLLPVPSGEVMISDLVQFRERYNDERRRMMTAIEDLLRQLGREGRHPQDVFHRVEHELNEAAVDLRAAARAAKVTWVIRPLAVAVAVVTTSLAGAVLPEVSAPLGVVSGMAINIATNQMRKATGRNVRNPAAYMYLHRANKVIARLD
jgi:hypothetical protein